MKKNLSIILVTSAFVLITSSSFGQFIISGKVESKQSEAIPYANIGIKRGKIGTVSKDDGRFNISIPDSLANDSLTFSSIGFKDKSYLISSLKDKNNLIVVLDEKIISLTEIKVTNNKLKQYKLGITGRTPMLSIPTKSYQKTDIIEQARLIHLKKPAKLLNANIYVISESLKDVNIRLNFYSLENGLPGKRLIEKSIIRNAKINKGWFSIDLKDQAIYIDEDFVVAFEYLPGTQNTIVFGAKLGASDSFLRSSSQGIWRKNVLGGCSIYITAEM
ncbi:carboxypeptidase-like regulatory domain-containing protein [Pedobacter sp. Leaf170]|uniref:carboxypeptidase-like regulatory domain-containing protein n=1 Tax=Pedobacter sp. Leaf170 TaxID=2876558 RepID=UPI001E4AB9DC|nr:carboxypeptidase-like regulatory domain-containing protein [Pedobacter sp. Leaf170]